jgi:hypothetical protein
MKSNLAYYRIIKIFEPERHHERNVLANGFMIWNILGEEYSGTHSPGTIEEPISTEIM